MRAIDAFRWRKEAEARESQVILSLLAGATIEGVPFGLGAILQLKPGRPIGSRDADDYTLEITRDGRIGVSSYRRGERLSP